MYRSRPFLDEHARLNERFGGNCPFFALLFVILPVLYDFVLLKGVRYAEIQEINDITSAKNTSMIEQTTKDTSARFAPVPISPVFCFKNARLLGEKAPF